MTAFENPVEIDAGKEQEMRERRENVSELLSQGWTEKKIAKHLNVSYATVLRDVKYLKEQTIQWIDDLAKTDFIFEVKKSVGELENLKTRLYEYLDDDTLETPTKLKIFKELREIMNLKLKTLAEYPTLQGLKRIVNRSGSPQTQPYNFNNNV